MFKRSELEFRSRACLAQLKLRVVAFSIAVGVPIWIGATVLQKLGAQIPFGIGWLVLLIAYLAGVIVIVRRTQRGHGLICPHCNALLGVELGRVKDGGCRRCGEKLVETPI